MEDVLVVIPTFNESESITALLARLDRARDSLSDKYHIEILIVDDSSADKTAEIARSLNLKNLLVLSQVSKSGLGQAYIAGFKQGLIGNYQYFVEMDADLSHQPEQLSDLLAVASEKDLVIGTRWMSGGKVVNWPIGRRILSKFGTKYAAFVLNLPYKDLTSGYRVLSRQLLMKIDLDQIQTRGYGFQIEIALKAIQSGFKIKEVPITFVERENGRSKMGLAIVWEAWRMITKWGFIRVLNHR
ncbi:MAG: glycosyltransferase [Actinobacteria bacterium]|nr:glycosyltransferase [Actinomycetota bacterium]